MFLYHNEQKVVYYVCARSAGVSNEFLVATHADSALTYNDSSVNENMHCSLAFRLLRNPANNFLEVCVNMLNRACSSGLQ